MRLAINFRVVELREILAEIGVGRQAIAAAVELGDGERDALARRRRQSTLVQRAGEAEIAFQRGGAVRDEAEQVRHDAELLFDGFEQRLRGGGSGARSWRELGCGTWGLPFRL